MQSDVSGDLRVVYGREPLDLTVPMYDNFRPTRAVSPPVAYIVPVQWSDVIEVLKAHGLEFRHSPRRKRSKSKFIALKISFGRRDRLKDGTCRVLKSNKQKRSASSTPDRSSCRWPNH